MTVEVIRSNSGTQTTLYNYSLPDDNTVCYKGMQVENLRIR